jgi:hypothetical protein
MLKRYSKLSVLLVIVFSFTLTGCKKVSEMTQQLEKALKIKVVNQTNDDDYCAEMQLRWFKSDYKRLPGYEKFVLGSELRKRYKSIIIKETNRTKLVESRKDILQLISPECGALNSMDCMNDEVIVDKRTIGKVRITSGIRPRPKLIKEASLSIATEKEDTIKTTRIFRTQNEELFDTLNENDFDAIENAISNNDVILHNQTVQNKVYCGHRIWLKKVLRK